MPSFQSTRAAAPYPQGMRLPTFRYTLISADEQVRMFVYALSPGGEALLVNDTGWDDEDALLHTAEASLEIAWPGREDDEVLSLTGDQHRELEDCGRFDELLRGIGSGLPPRVVLSQLTVARQAA